MATKTIWAVVPEKFENNKVVVRKNFKVPNKHNYTIINIPYNEGKNNIGILVSGIAKHSQVSNYNLIPLSKDGVRAIISHVENGKYIKEKEIILPQAHILEIIENAFPVENSKDVSYLTFKKENFVEDNGGYKVYLPDYFNDLYGKRYISTNPSNVFMSSKNDDLMCLSIYNDTNYSLFDENGNDLIVNSNEIIKNNKKLYNEEKKKEDKEVNIVLLKESEDKFKDENILLSDTEKENKDINLFNNTPNCLLTFNSHNINENMNLSVSYKNYENILSNKYITDINELKDLINNPMCIVRGSNENTYLIITDKIIDNQNVVIPIKSNNDENGFSQLEILDVSLKENIEFYIEKEFNFNCLMACNTKKIEKLLIYDRLLLPNTKKFSIYDDSITNNMLSVNRQNDSDRSEICKSFIDNNKNLIYISRSDVVDAVNNLNLTNDLKEKIIYYFDHTEGDYFIFDDPSLSDSMMYNILLAERIENDRKIVVSDIKHNQNINNVKKSIKNKKEYDIDKALSLYQKIYDYFYERDGYTDGHKPTKEHLAENILLKYENNVDRNLINKMCIKRGDPFISDREFASYILSENIIKNTNDDYDINDIDVSLLVNNLLNIKEKKKISENSNKIEDFGKKIGGAKKDLWKEKGLSIADLSEMNVPEKVKLVNKKNIWIKPDYQKLVDNGMSRDLAYFYKNVIDAIPVTFHYLSSYSEAEIDKEVNKYINFINKIKDKVLSYKDISEVSDFNDFLRSEFMEGYYIKDEWANININKLLRMSHDYEYNFKSIVRKMNKQEFCMNEKEAYEKNFKEAFDIIDVDGMKARFSKSSYDDNYSLYYTGNILSLSKEKYEELKDKKFLAFDNKKYELLGADSKEELMTLIKDRFDNRNKENEKDGKRKKKFKYKSLDFVGRNGDDYRKGKDATGDDFLKDFDLYGGEFGNWENQDERQKNLNFAYDSFMDLSKVLGFDPKDISIGNRLSIAFGARGGGKALASYEPLRKVINLTKMKGAGSLAHEFGHFIDNMVAILVTEDKKADSFKDYASEIAYLPKFTKVIKEYEILMKTMKTKKATYDDCVKYRNDQLDKIEKDCFRYIKQYKDSEFYKKFENIFTGLKEHKDIKDINKEYNNLCVECKKFYSQKYDDSIKDNYNMAYFIKRNEHIIENHIKKYDYLNTNERLNYYVENLNLDSDFYKNSKLFDGDFSKEGHGYWASDCEMFARAFACYCKDKLEKLGINNTYLCGHADQALSYNGNDIVRAFPYGEEREKINSCFDKLFVELNEKIFNFDKKDENILNSAKSIKEKNEQYEKEKEEHINNFKKGLEHKRNV